MNAAGRLAAGFPEAAAFLAAVTLAAEPRAADRWLARFVAERCAVASRTSAFFSAARGTAPCRSASPSSTVMTW